MIGNLGIMLNIKSLSLGPVSLVFSMEGLQVIYVFIMALLLSLFFPKIIKEEIDKKNIILKTSALIIILAGIAVLYLF